MLIHQAIYGERNGAHSLLAKSSEDKEPFSTLTAYTDRPPGDVPASVQWTPFVGGFVFGAHYVVTKTFPDPTATRSGMVRTHALIAELDELVQVSDLAAFLSHLSPRAPFADAAETLLPISWSPDERADAPGGGETTLGLAKVASLLVSASDGQPIVWMGQAGFEAIVAALWRHLWPQARRRFTFGLSFQPQDRERNGILLLATPAALSARWTQHETAGPEDVHVAQSRAEAFLLGLPEGEPLRDMMASLQIELESPATLHRVEQCAKYLEMPTPNFSDALAGARLVAYLAPRADQGVGLKKEVMARLVERLLVEPPDALISLRNFDATPFRDGEREMEQATELWAQRNLLKMAHAEAVAGLLCEALLPDERPVTQAWAARATRATEGVLRSWPVSAPAAIWRWWQQEPLLAASLESVLPPQSEVEMALVRECPAHLEPQVAATVRASALKRKWLCLHAVAVAASLEAQGAFRAQLGVDRDSESLAALRLMAARVSSKALLAIALEANETRLHHLAGEACAQDSSLLSGLDVRNAAWRLIWSEAVGAGTDPWQGIADPSQTMTRLLDVALDGEPVEVALLQALAQTPFGNLTDYARRTQVWSGIPTEAAQKFLNVTAQGWLRRFLEGTGFEDGNLEQPLQSAITNEDLLSRSVSPTDGRVVSMLSALRLFERLPALPQRLLLRWLPLWLRGRNLTFPEAEAVGKLVSAKGWREAAELLLREVSTGRSDLKAALSPCRNLLNLWDRVRAGMLLAGPGQIGVSREELQSLWLEVAAARYPDGPTHNRIWERAGGDLSKLPSAHTGRARWEGAFGVLRYGGGGKITVKKLLQEMANDFSQSEELRLLQTQIHRLELKE